MFYMLNLELQKRKGVGAINNRLKEVREKRGWTQQELAEKSGVSRTTIWMLENHKTDCANTNTLVRLADALNMKVSSLFF